MDLNKNNIDIVIPWVDGSDKEWLSLYEKFSGNKNKRLNGDERFRDYGTLKYVFRSIDIYAPWVHKIFLITNGQKPAWLNINNEKLCLVTHEDYIDEEYLPTFNSNVIEGNIPNISDLSNKFILFNDDTILNGDTSRDDFFKNGLPRESAILNPVFPTENGIDSIVMNDLSIINHYFKKKDVVKNNFFKFYNYRYGFSILKTLLLFPHNSFCGFVDMHLPVSYDKEIFENVIKNNKKSFVKTFHNRFRSSNDVNHWLVRYWQICSGYFFPRTIKFGKYYSIDEINSIEHALRNEEIKMICLNDKQMESSSYYDVTMKLTELLENKFSKKSSFEL